MLFYPGASVNNLIALFATTIACIRTPAVIALHKKGFQVNPWQAGVEKSDGTSSEAIRRSFRCDIINRYD